MFETFGSEHEFVFNQPSDQIWTLLEEDGAMWISNGRHFVNRMGYFITEVPWSQDIEVPLCEADEDRDDDLMEPYEDTDLSNS